jgi:YD repeat-containing protein
VCEDSSSSFYALLRYLGLLGFALCLLTSVPPAAAQQCLDSLGYSGDLWFVPQPGESPPEEEDSRCDDGFWCFQGKDLGPFIRIAGSGCDPTVGACELELRFPLEFKGNETNIAEHPNQSPPKPGVFWLAGEAPQSCQPWLSSNCGQIGICGTFIGEINDDFIETLLILGSASCEAPTPARSGLFSIIAVTCSSQFSCPKREFASFTVSPQSVRTALGCPDPPKQDCDDCMACPLSGVPADGRGPRIGGAQLGAGGGAYLHYAAGGAGSHPKFPGTAQWNIALGRNWSHSYATRLFEDPDATRVWLIEKSGTFREFRNPDGSGAYQTVSPSTEKRTLTWLGAGSGWTLAELDGTVHLYSDSGRWLSTTDRNGNATVGTYGAGELSSVALPDGRREEFTYFPSGDPAEGKLATIVEVGVENVTTRTWEYTWSGPDLVRVDRPDGTALLFSYGDPSLPGYLTRIELEGTDGTSVRVQRGYEYDVDGHVTKTWRGDPSPTGPNAVDVWSLALDDPDLATVATITPPVGGPITYQLGRDTVSSNVKVLQVSGDCPTCGLSPNSQLSYGDPQNPMLPTEIVDGRGTRTVMSYDAFGQMTSRTEAFTEPEERTTTWTYDATYPALVTSIEQPSVAGGAAFRATDWLLDASGNALERTISGVEAGSGFALTTETTYNAAGQPLVIDPPGHGTADQTSFTYDPARGGLVADSRSDPLIGTTTFDHDAFNRRTSVTDPNGVEATTVYDPLDRVSEVRQVGANPPADDLVTSHAYTAFGDLFRTTLPLGNLVEYGYDAAGRLLSVERKPDMANHGERVLYTLDAAGNRTLEELQRWDAGAGAWLTFSWTAYEYSTRCQVDRLLQAPGSLEEAVTEYGYDCNGNLSAQWDPNHDAQADPPTTSYTYDALDRLTEVSQPWAGGGTAVTGYSYDIQDHLVAVTDAEANTTSYTYSDRDLLTQEVSPVSGTTTHGYDEHGELVSTTDARGVTVNRTVDVLDRVTFVDYPDDALDTSYIYDAEPVACGGASFEIGRLGAITRAGESVEYCYDRFGRATRDGELTYSYDTNGNRTGIGYPGGVAATYSHDFADREVTLAVTSPGGAEPVVQAATYLPSGPLSALQLGSGTTETRSFDGRYGPTAIALTGPVERTFTYTTDLVGNILEIVEQGACTPGPVVLESQTVTTTETFTSCTTIEAGNGFAVESPGDVTFLAEGTIALKDGFSVGTGARFVAAAGGIPPTSIRSYAYQAPQYFLTAADGPWGTLDWSYDRIGNRLSEARDGGSPDTYQYLVNAGTGNTPILDQVLLGVGGTRDYTYGLAGHLEDVAAGANVIDFGADAEGRLSGATRTAADVSAVVSYDGRSFLRRAVEMAGDPPAEGASAEAVYDSGGLLHALRRQAGPTEPEELVVHVYLAGRPVAQVAIAGAGAETWTYVTTDHLGTPLLATDDAGAVTWEGGLEPFGRDYQAGTPAGASESGIFLRLPGQWQDTSWADATSGAGVAHNVARWLEVGTGRYTQPDPLGVVNRGAFSPSSGQDPLRQLYGYAEMNPVIRFDPLGLKSRVCCKKIPVVGVFGFRHCYIEIQTDKGRATCGLFGGPGSGEPPGTGRIHPNAGFDKGGDCGDWSDDDDCEADQCVVTTAQGYSNPSQYDFNSGPNSNTFAGNIARKCKLDAPSEVGWKTPGWNDSPAPPRKGPDGKPLKPEAVRCKLP